MQDSKIMSRIRIDGWFYEPLEVYFGDKDRKYETRVIDSGPRFDTIKLDMSRFKYSCKEVDTDNLEILPMIRYVGGFFTSKRVHAVLHKGVEGSHIPFFIERKELMELSKLISNSLSPPDEKGGGTV
jgi:hypothetical protein